MGGGNPMPVNLQASLTGGLTLMKDNMGKILDGKYDGGAKIPLSAALAVRVGKKHRQK